MEAHLTDGAPPPSESSGPLTTRSAPPALDRWMPNGTTKLAPPVNHVFVDFENVQEIDLAVVGNQTVSFTMLLGPQQTKMKVTVVEKLLEHAASVQFVRLVSTGPNALDFTLSYYIGRAAATDPNGFFHIISKDKGFDPLIEHLRSKHIRACRHDDFTALRFSGSAKPHPSPGELPDRLLEQLRNNPNNRPKRKKTLASHLFALSGKMATEAEVDAVIGNLRRAGHLDFDEKDAVTYRL
jgi:hypothetical protein